MFRFDAKMGYYLFPAPSGPESEIDLTLRLNKGTTYENNVEERADIKIIKHGLGIPSNATNYETFVSAIKQNEKEFHSHFLNHTSAVSEN